MKIVLLVLNDHVTFDCLLMLKQINDVLCMPLFSVARKPMCLCFIVHPCSVTFFLTFVGRYATTNTNPPLRPTCEPML